VGKLYSIFKDTFAIKAAFFSHNVCSVAMTSNYKQVFTIHIQIRVAFQLSFDELIPNIDLKSTIDYPYLQYIRSTHQLEGKIH
jgi:hypothetical protein